ncbi:MAG: peptidylprolyl isomerase [Ruminococcaceae bacterium]|nr:peptidylprolyl isomerase [Oscillospiraceae bacterium]
MISVKDKGEILVRLYEEVAPTTVANFKKLVAEGFYNGLIFHRVIKDFMIQGGCPEGNGTGGSGTNIYGEFAQNGFTNNLSHKKGVVSMARSNDPNSASSQFFIMHADNAGLDGGYAAFGFVVYGQDVVDAIATVETEKNDKPVTDVVIESIRFVNIS